MAKKNLLSEAIEHAPNRRSFLNKVALGTAALTAGARFAGAQSSGGITDVDIVNFALNLEYLEAEFYTVATTGQTIDQMGIGVTGSGTPGNTTGGAKVNFAGGLGSATTGGAITGGTNSNGATTLAIALNIALDERQHVTFLRNALTAAGATPIARPAINLNALGIGFSGPTDFLQLARIFEEIGVSAYGGAAPLIQDKGILGAAARILAVEALHTGNIRLQIAALGIPTTPIDAVDVLPPPSGSDYFTVDSNALTPVRTPAQVLYLAYGNAANASKGGFFPNGVNGTINMSGMAAGSASGAVALVTPSGNQTNITTSSIVLDASGSTLPSGATTMFVVVPTPGGLTPAILQSPGNSKATIQFVMGVGSYYVQLKVVDAMGNVLTTSPVITLIRTM